MTAKGISTAGLLGLAVVGLIAFALVGRSAGALTNCDVHPDQIALNANELAFLGLLNDYRAQHGAPALMPSTPLNRAAAWLAADMAEKKYLDHTDSLGRGAFQRFPQCGYPYGGGENILFGTASAQVAFNLWKGSQGHDANMRNPAYRVVGIGYQGGFWVTTFGTTVYGVDETPQAPTATSTPSPTPLPTATPTMQGVSVPGVVAE